MGNIKILLLTLCLLESSIAVAPLARGISAKYTREEIVVDGELNKEVWDETESGADFIQYFPTDSLPARFPTSFKINLPIG